MALERSRRYQPDIIVLDLEMPLLSGVDVTKELRKLGPPRAVEICSVESDQEMIETAQQVGALGYVFKMRMDQRPGQGPHQSLRGLIDYASRVTGIDVYSPPFSNL